MSGSTVLKHVFDDVELARLITGERGANLRVMEREAAVRVSHRGNLLQVRGEPREAELVARVVSQLEELVLADRRRGLSADDVAHAMRLGRRDPDRHLRQYFGDTVLAGGRMGPITPRTVAQKVYVDAMRRHDVVFGIGPAGTGKTYLAMAMAVAAFKRGDVARIVLTRPAVEAGERLGFLPGDLQEKVSPYLRPLHDALHDMMDLAKARRLLERGVIEVAPLAFMRGRTLNDSYVILDEAQNTTSEQMKMFLTRLGVGSHAVITGDVTQIDLPGDRLSGLVEAARLLRQIDGIAFVRFTERDVVRHDLVQQIIRAYDGQSTRRNGRDGEAAPAREDG